MGPVYLIDKSIYFYPKSHRLVCLAQEKEDTTLTQPAAKCLELLIISDGLVSQNSLYDYAWGENSHNVSPNTLYQNISLIRRALKNIQTGADRWIITVPRKGFRFDHSIFTRLLSAEEIRPGFLPAPAVSEPKTKAKSLKILIPCSLFGLFFSLAFIFNPVDDEFKKLMKGYEKLAVTDSCQFYVDHNHDPLKEQLYSQVNQYIDCNSYPHIYISYNKIIKNISLFSCQVPLIESSKHCASWSLGDTL
ncbi:MAG: winged helix-turn-helix domain-containing protein [Pantoea sp.]|nr:winged helix-turn-helix domain-containing protein [Pantoea sp.]